MKRQRNRQSGAWILRGCLILAVTIAWPFPTTGDESGADIITFRFNPPDSTRVVQVLRSVRDKDMGELGRQRDETEVRTLVEMTRTSRGFRVVATPQSFRMMRDGQEIQDPIQDLLQDVVITYLIDENGRLVEVLGFEGFAANMRESLAPMMTEEQLAAIEPLISEEALVQREFAEWNGRIGGYVGMLISASGDAVTGVAPYTLPTGETIEYQTLTIFSPPQECCQGDCIEIRTVFDTDASVLASIAERFTGGIELPEIEDMEIGETTISGEATRLMDPSTMLICEESSTRTIRMSVELPGIGTVPMTAVETREYASEYE